MGWAFDQTLRPLLKKRWNSPHKSPLAGSGASNNSRMVALAMWISLTTANWKNKVARKSRARTRSRDRRRIWSRLNKCKWLQLSNTLTPGRDNHGHGQGNDVSAARAT